MFILLSFIFLLIFSSAQAAGTANGTGTATVSVIPSIGISTVSSLVFGNGAPGDAAKVVAPGVAENATNASFNVTGGVNSVYTITLPASATMNRVGGGGTIAVTAFTSTPAAGAGTGNLGAGGAQTLFVGATRAALGAAQATGNYTGTFTVTVNY